MIICLLHCKCIIYTCLITYQLYLYFYDQLQVILLTCISKWFYDTSIGTAIRSVRYGLLLDGLSLLYAQTRWTRGFTWFELAECNTLHSQEMLYCHVCVWHCWRMSSIFLLLSSARPFIAQGRAVTLWPKAQQVVLGWLNSYTVGHYQLEVANDVFNDMEYVMSCHSATPYSVSNMTPCCRIVWHCNSVLWVVNRVDVALQQHRSRLSARPADIKYAVYLYILQAHDGSDASWKHACVC
jgi:hypothetical protein